MRFIYGVRRNNKITNKLVQYIWIDMFARRRLYLAMFYYKIVKYKTPMYLLEKVEFRTDVHNVNVSNIY